MRKVILACVLLVSLCVGVQAATNNVTISWKNPVVDTEGNALPSDAVTNYQVMVSANMDMTGATKAMDVPASPGGSGVDVIETAIIQLVTGQWYISVIPVDKLGQSGVMVTPVVYSVVVPPAGVRELQIVGSAPGVVSAMAVVKKNEKTK